MLWFRVAYGAYKVVKPTDDTEKKDEPWTKREKAAIPFLILLYVGMGAMVGLIWWGLTHD